MFTLNFNIHLCKIKTTLKKNMTTKTISTILLLIIITVHTFAQNITTDTTLAKQYYALGDKYYYESNIDSSTFYYQKAADVYKKVAQVNNDTLMWAKHIRCIYDVSLNYTFLSNFDLSISILDTALIVCNKYLGYFHKQTANVCESFGTVYYNKSEYDKALEYYFKSLDIYKELFGEKHDDVATSYNNIGVVYEKKSEYDKALQYNLKSLEIKKEFFGEKHVEVADSYNNIGVIYFAKLEYDKALQYFFKSLEIKKELLGEQHADIAISYNNIGAVYYDKSEYDKAHEYFFKCLEIEIKLFGEKNEAVATSYNNIGAYYIDKSEQDKALQYYFKALKIRKELFGEKHVDVAISYNNIGIVYQDKYELDKALQYFFKSLEIRKELFGEKHIYVSISYSNIGRLFRDSKQFETALKYLHLGMSADLRDFNDTTDITKVPAMKNYLEYIALLEVLQAKAEIFTYHSKDLTGFENLSGMELALQHYQAADTLISLVRQDITYKSDKLTLGEKANSIYKGAINVCFNLSNIKTEHALALQTSYKEQAFYFSEKVKTRIFLDELAEKQAVKKSNIPENLIEKEKDLRSSISLYKNKLSEQLENEEESKYKSELFATTREYEQLIEQLTEDYPKYAELKYNQNVPLVADIQSVIKTNTAVRSYTVADSLIFIITITEINFEIDTVSKPANMNKDIGKMKRYLENDNKSDHKKFADVSYRFYNLLFPEYADFNNNIENIIIVPNDSLSLIPFETLLTEKRTDDYHNFSNYPFLLQKYSISYAPSVTMLYNKINYNYENTSNKVAIFAPIFSDNDSIIIDKSYSEFETENALRTIKESCFTDNNGSIKELKYSKLEANKIKKIFNPNAHKYMYRGASEEIVKSDIMQEYKIVHFATHGEANTEKQYLSKVVLTQDSTSKEDGMLHANEIYGLNWNADLVTLSACQTAAGKVQNGEGVMDLSRAFFHAGTNNVLASLWSVNDKSTAVLMIQFYKNYNNKNMTYAQALQQAKLKMLKSKEFSHPKYWAAFLLIGRN